MPRRKTQETPVPEPTGGRIEEIGRIEPIGVSTKEVEAEAEKKLPPYVIEAIKSYAQAKGITLVEALFMIANEYFKATQYQDLTGAQVFKCFKLIEDFFELQRRFIYMASYTREELLIPYSKTAGEIQAKAQISALRETLDEIFKLIFEEGGLATRIRRIVEEHVKSEVREQSPTQPQSQATQQKTGSSIIDYLVLTTMERIFREVQDKMVEYMKKQGLDEQVAKLAVDVLISMLSDMAAKAKPT